MQGFKGRFSPQASKTSIIKITGYEDKNFVGTLQNACYRQPKGFTNLTQLLLYIETSQDSLQYPQRGMEPRSFQGDGPGQRESVAQVDNIDPLALPRAEASAEGTLATFKVDLLFRQNASWQGNVVWLDSGVEAQFRSVLELIHLMDSVLK